MGNNSDWYIHSSTHPNGNPRIHRRTERTPATMVLHSHGSILHSDYAELPQDDPQDIRWKTSGLLRRHKENG